MIETQKDGHYDIKIEVGEIELEIYYINDFSINLF